MFLLLWSEIEIELEVDVRIILLQIHLQPGHSFFCVDALQVGQVVGIEVLVKLVENLPQSVPRFLLRLEYGGLEVDRKSVPAVINL